MVQSPWETNWFAASQEIPLISRNPKVHYRTLKGPPPVSILGQPNPVHIPTSQLLEIHPNIIHPSKSRYPQWSLSLRFPHQDPIHPPLLTHMRHMPSPYHSSRLEKRNIHEKNCASSWLLTKTIPTYRSTKHKIIHSSITTQYNFNNWWRYDHIHFPFHVIRP